LIGSPSSSAWRAFYGEGLDLNREPNDGRDVAL
jgi:hypothetical protein